MSFWFYTQGGKTYGPISLTELKAAAHLQFFGPDDLVRRHDSPTWVTAATISELFQDAAK